MQMKTLSILFLAIASTVQAATINPGISIHDNVLDPGNTTLLIGLPGRNDTVVLAAYILRTDQEQQQSLFHFVGFPASFFNQSAGITILVEPQYKLLAQALNSRNLTTSDLAQGLRNINPNLFAGVVGPDADGSLAFGGRDFIEDVGAANVPVTFTLQRYDFVGVDINRFLTDRTIGRDYRLGMFSNPANPFIAPETVDPLYILDFSFVILAFLRKTVCT